RRAGLRSDHHAGAAPRPHPLHPGRGPRSPAAPRRPGGGHLPRRAARHHAHHPGPAAAGHAAGCGRLRQGRSGAPGPGVHRRHRPRPAHLPGGLDRGRAPCGAVAPCPTGGGPDPGGDDPAGAAPLRPAAAFLNCLWGAGTGGPDPAAKNVSECENGGYRHDRRPEVPPMTALAANYTPLDIEIATAEGAWVTDTAGRSYLDCLAGYSALNFGHRHPDLLAAAHTQLDRLTLTSRALRHDQLRPFAEAITGLTSTEMFLPMNTGAEAVETAIKAARKWGYE